jgi:hypothetical protein
MPQRTRKLIGILLTPLYLTVYALVLMALAGQYIVGSGMLIELVFFVFAGFAWLPGAMAIIKWMARP